MTEKLLSRPPFAYIFDIISEVKNLLKVALAIASENIDRQCFFFVCQQNMSSVYFQVQLYLKSGTSFEIRFYQVPKVPEKLSGTDGSVP